MINKEEKGIQKSKVNYQEISKNSFQAYDNKYGTTFEDNTNTYVQPKISCSKQYLSSNRNIKLNDKLDEEDIHPLLNDITIILPENKDNYKNHKRIFINNKKPNNFNENINTNNTSMAYTLSNMTYESGYSHKLNHQYVKGVKGCKQCKGSGWKEGKDPHPCYDCAKKLNMERKVQELAENFGDNMNLDKNNGEKKIERDYKINVPITSIPLGTVPIISLPTIKEDAVHKHGKKHRHGHQKYH